MTDDVTISGHANNSSDNLYFVARLGEHIRCNPEPIARYSLRTLARVSEDAATIAESVALADRLVTRRRSQGWHRHLALKIPLIEPSAMSGEAHAALSDALTFLTGDHWELRFVSRSNPPASQSYLALAPKQPTYVVPYSGGLDSFAQSRLLESDHGEDAVLRLNSGMIQGGKHAGLLSVPRRFYAGHARELTYRTRPFVYFSMTGIAAATLGAKAVVIGENGQGSLGPSYARFGNEWPFRSTHPGFIDRFERYLSLLLREQIKFVQPQLWKTKGQVLAELKLRKLVEGWEHTNSCSARPLQRNGRKGCGICGGCMLRQTAVHAAQLTPSTETSFAPHSADLEMEVADGGRLPMTRNERQIVSRSALSMDHFARLCDRPDHPQIVAREALDITSEGRDVPTQIYRLSRAHAAEWQSFLNALPQHAWLRKQFILQ